MLVRQPESRIFRVLDRDGHADRGLLAMRVGGGLNPNGQPAGLAMVEVEPEVWEIMSSENLNRAVTGTTGDCITVRTVRGLVGYALPEAFEGRALPRRVAMREPELARRYESIDDVRAKYPDAIVGHEWVPSKEDDSYQWCSRCRTSRKA